MLKERYCPHCGSTYIRSETDGCNGPRSYTCSICDYSVYHAFPSTFPKHPKITPSQFAALLLEECREWPVHYGEATREAVELYINQINESHESTPETKP